MQYLLLLAGLHASLGVWGAVLFQDDFSYPDGVLQTVSQQKWIGHSGGTNEVDATGGHVNLTGSETQDVNTLLPGQPFRSDSSTILYASFKVNFSALPSGNGSYFAHFKDSGTGFRARVWALSANSSTGHFHLGLTSESASPADPLATNDLALNTDYRIVVRLSVSNALATLWIDPTAETAPSISTTAGKPITVVAFALRQSSGMGTLAFDDLRIGTEFSDVVKPPVTGDPPTILIQPQDRSTKLEAPVAFYVSAAGTPPLTYQWFFNGVALPNATNVFYTVLSASVQDAGGYSVVVRNQIGLVSSDTAHLTIELPSPEIISTNIAYLRALVDPVNFLPPISGNLFTVQGIVTTFTNMTSPPDLQFFIQDGISAISVYATNGSLLLPKPGDRVSVTGPLTDDQGLLQLGLDASNSLHGVRILNSGEVLPIPLNFDISLQHDPALIETDEGRLVIISNVVLNLSSATFRTNGDNVTMTNLVGETINLRVNRGSEWAGQPKPLGLVTVIGILAQADETDPRTSGYEIIPRSLQDIILPALPPIIHFTNILRNLIRAGDSPTNTFAENSLHAGETLTMSVTIADPAGLNLRITVDTNTMPTASAWSFDATAVSRAAATLVFAPEQRDRGSNFTFSLFADNGQTTNAIKCEVYVPTLLEEKLVLTEFLANPASSAASLIFNPLNRATPAPNPATDDEFIELVNFSGQPIDLAGWTISDSQRVRHRFATPFSVASSNAIVVYGGPQGGAEPSPSIPAVPASESTSGLSLNNSGGDSIIIRNAHSNLVSRTIYSTLPSNSSLTRAPDLNGNFSPQLSVSTNAVSPGRNYDGQPFLTAAIPTIAAISVTASFAEAGRIEIRWATQSGLSYSVHQSTAVDGAYHAVATRLMTGIYSIQFQPEDGPTFFRISSP